MKPRAIISRCALLVAAMLAAACERQVLSPKATGPENVVPSATVACPVAGGCVAPSKVAQDAVAHPRSTLSTASGPWSIGDVFVGVSSGTYYVYDNNGVFKGSVSDGLGGFTTGCSFNPFLSRLYTTNFGNTKVVAYADADPHPVVQVINTGAVNPFGHSESILFDGSNNFYVGHPDGNRQVQKYDPAGNLLASFAPATEDRGTDWIDLASDQKTLYYTSEGGRVLRFDLSTNAQLPDLADIGGVSYALRLLSPGDGSGGLIVAHTLDLKRLDAAGNVVQTYDAPGEDTWFSMNLDPNGTSFWAGNFGSSNFYRFNIATGAIEVGPVNTGTGPGTIFGICLKAEPTAAVVHVLIDIKPGSDPNSIKLNSQGDASIAVAVLTTNAFDAATVDPATVQLGDGNAPDVPVTARNNGSLMADLEDVNGDGRPDMVLHFSRTSLIGTGDLTPSTTSLTLTGKTTKGTLIVGKDSVRVIP